MSTFLVDYNKYLCYNSDVNSRLLSQLAELNLTDHEARIYLALLELGQTSARDIITKTQLHRSVIYDTLIKLVERKLASKTIRNNIASFQATDPERILQNITAQAEQVKSLIPALKALYRSGGPEIIVYEGVASYRRFWIESMQRMPIGSTDYVAGSIGSVWEEHMGSLVKQYFKIARERSIGWKMVVFDKDDYEQTFFRKYPDLIWKCRLVNENVSKEGNFNVFADESVILHSTVEPMIIEIKSASLVKVFRNLFDVMWNAGKELHD